MSAPEIACATFGNVTNLTALAETIRKPVTPPFFAPRTLLLQLIRRSKPSNQPLNEKKAPLSGRFNRGSPPERAAVFAGQHRITVKLMAFFACEI